MEGMSLYKIGQFRDGNGQPRTFTVCGIIQIPEPENQLVLASVAPAEKFGLPNGKMLCPVQEYNEDGHVKAELFLGIAVCNLDDEFNAEKGREIAKKRALKGKSHQKWVHTDFPEIFTQGVLQAIVDAYCDMVIADPEKYAPGYQKNQHIEAYNSLTDAEKLLVEALRRGSFDLAKLQTIAKGLPETHKASNA